MRRDAKDFVERLPLRRDSTRKPLPVLIVTDSDGYTVYVGGLVATAGQLDGPNTSNASTKKVLQRDAGTMPRFAYWDKPAENPAYFADEDMPDLYRRVLSDVGPHAAECIYLTIAKIREALQWDKLEVIDDIKQRLLELCMEFRDIFASEGNSGKLDTTQHSIDTEHIAPIKSCPYRFSPEKRAIVRDAIAKMLEKGVIEPSVSPWSSPIVLVEKRNGEYRFCTDYRKLNAITKKDRYPLPRIDDRLEKLMGADFFSTFDLASGFWQIPIYLPQKEKQLLLLNAVSISTA